MNKVYRYLTYGLFGLFSEICYTGIGSLFIHGDIRLKSQTYLWMFFIYSLAIFIEPIHNKIRILPVILRGVIYTIVIFSIEYLTGYILKNTIGVCPWNYGNNNFSINGLIELDFAPVWFSLGLLFEKLHDFLIEYRFLIVNKNCSLNIENIKNRYDIKKIDKILKIIKSNVCSNRKIK